MKNPMPLPDAEPAAQTEFRHELVKKIINPLQKRKGIEDFQANLADAIARISDGTLHNVREVEVVLGSTSQVSDSLLPTPSSLVLIAFSGLPDLLSSSRDFEDT